MGDSSNEPRAAPSRAGSGAVDTAGGRPAVRAAADEALLYRRELDRLRRATQDLRGAFHERERALEQARREAREATATLERLRSRRSVRALLTAAELTRGIRKGGARSSAAGATSGDPTEPGADASGRGGARSRDRSATEVLGPAAYRARLRRRIIGETPGERLQVALAGRGSGDVAEALGRLPQAWTRQPLVPSPGGAHDCPPTADVVVVCAPDVDVDSLPRHPVRVGVVASDVDAWHAQPWFDDLDLVLTVGEAAANLAGDLRGRSAKDPTAVLGDGVAETLRAVLLAWTTATRISLAIATPSREVAEWWGDTHFGRALQRQFERHGHPTRLYQRDTYASPDLVRSDVALHVAGLATPRPQVGQVNVLWCISHPELVDGARCERYDLVLVASERFAAQLRPLVTKPVLALPQATDAERFHPDPSGPPHDLLFVGNSRRQRRTVIDDLTPTRHDLAVYGGDWTPDLLDPRHLRGEVVPNADLHRYYASAKIVLNDHWPDMARLGFVSNRVYDALASGALVISDHVDGLEQMFDGGVRTYRDRDELRDLVDRYLTDEDARRELAERGHRVVVDQHTFAHRVERVIRLVEPFLAVQKAAVCG